MRNKSLRSNAKYKLEDFLQSLEKIHVSLDNEFGEFGIVTEEERDVIFEKHNMIIQGLLYFSKRIQRSDTLSEGEKLSRLRAIADVILKYDCQMIDGRRDCNWSILWGIHYLVWSLLIL